jgi:hypothetical protein
LPSDSFPAEVAYEVKGYSEGYDVLEKKQSQKTHIPHVAYSRNGDDRTRGRYDHRAGDKEHDRSDKSPHDTGLGPDIAYANQDGGRPTRGWGRAPSSSVVCSIGRTNVDELVPTVEPC